MSDVGALQGTSSAFKRRTGCRVSKLTSEDGHEQGFHPTPEKVRRGMSIPSNTVPSTGFGTHSLAVQLIVFTSGLLHQADDDAQRSIAPQCSPCPLHPRTPANICRSHPRTLRTMTIAQLCNMSFACRPTRTTLTVVPVQTHYPTRSRAEAGVALDMMAAHELATALEAAAVTGELAGEIVDKNSAKKAAKKLRDRMDA
ncbi:hypothetical protein HaLaN_20995 [Haematococcus lacustris]|uniref:Uncharacterized protein n=1 Tax=Haematococcus lacustris TaxID=44745 RepID=A0A699ZQE3_HAELA|nr:hypothetical protein HaLaN_20995 [Haematococcus lacustris]